MELLEFFFQGCTRQFCVVLQIVLTNDVSSFKQKIWTDHKHKDIEKSTHVKKSRCYHFDVRSQSGISIVSRNYEGG